MLRITGSPSAASKLQYSSCSVWLSPHHVLKSEVTAITIVSVQICKPAVLPEKHDHSAVAKLLWSLQELLAVHVSDHRKEKSQIICQLLRSGPQWALIIIFLKCCDKSECCDRSSSQRGNLEAELSSSVADGCPQAEMMVLSVEICRSLQVC